MQLCSILLLGDVGGVVLSFNDATQPVCPRRPRRLDQKNQLLFSYRSPGFRLGRRQTLKYALFTSNQEILIMRPIWGNLA